MFASFAAVAPLPVEVTSSRPGDAIVADADVVMDRGFTVGATPEVVWPWLVQLGKSRAGWYLPRSVERGIPQPRRALRRIDPQWQTLRVGDLIPDYGGKNETFEVAIINAPTTLVYRSQRGRTRVSWAITLSAIDGGWTRVHLRLRLGPVRHRHLASSAGGFFDLATIAGMAAGLQERLRD
jgi:hypothetical protein